MNYYNRQEILRRCLWSIYHMTNPIDDFEIVICDDKSPAGTEAKPVVDEFKDLLPIRLFTRKHKQGKNCGMPLNIAAQQAKGDVLITHDPDFIHMTSIVNQVAGTFYEGNSQFHIAACYSVSEQKQKIVEKVDFSKPKAVIGLRDNITRNPAPIRLEGDDAWNCHSKYRNAGLGSIKAILRDDFMRLGGFDEDFYQYFGFEDTDFLRRVHQSGMPIALRDDMLVYHQWHYHANDTEDNTNRELGYKHHKVIYDRNQTEGKLIANQGRSWGKL